MKKVHWGGLLFLILILVLASGLTYLSLNQVSKADDKNDVQKMSIALVNEDEGTVFNDEELSFGDVFTKSIDRDSNHDWYVVSRGVAENGFENDSYNMVIVIPHDFTQKAISIESDAPEHVQLNYKINATGHDEIRAEAEKTASLILNDFNRQIIDVYFASVIGSLQDAQDSILSIVEKEELYTNTYNHSINNPLSEYTSQFQAIKDHTKISKNNFSNLEDILNTFENNTVDDIDKNKSYLANVADYSQLKDENSQMAVNFYEQLSQFGSALNNQDVLQQFAQLEMANQTIYNQFQVQQYDGYTSNILTNAAIIKSHFEHITQEVVNLEAKLARTLGSDLESTVRDRLSLAFKDAFDNKNIYLNTFFGELDDQAHQKMQDQIAKLPSLDLGDLKDSYLSEETVTQLKNAILVSNKYIQEEYEGYEHVTDKGKLLSTQIKDLKKIHTDGLEMTDSVVIQGDIESTYIFSLNIPEHIDENYDVSNLIVDGNNYTESYLAGDDIKLNDMNDSFDVSLTLVLNNQGSNIDVFQPITWRWELYPENADNGTEDGSGTTSREKSANDTVQEIESGELAESEEQPVSQDLDEVTDESIESELEDEDLSPLEVSEESVESEQETNDLAPLEASNPTEGNGEDIQPVIVKVTNNYIYHQVMSPTIDDATEILIHAASNTVSDYQRILALFEFYYGLDMESPTLAEELNKGNLTDLAKEYDTSLYYLYHETEVMELLENFVVENIAEKVTDHVREPIDKLHQQIAQHQKVVEKANEHAIQLAEEIRATNEQANIMNDNLGEILVDLAAWRENSIELIDDQSKILSNVDGELSVISTLDNEAQSLLMASESLAEQAKGNQNTAETVYETFEMIDNQADAIQESGSNLVTEAEDLSINLTEKLLSDQEFANNFAEVLGNSRIGDRQNEELYEFLSNPVEIKNNGTVTSGNTFTPYFLVLICFIVSLFTAYVISTRDQRNKEKDLFEREKTLIGKNASITIVTASIGFVEGILIGILSGYLLHMGTGKLIMWTGLITLIMLIMLLIATYLLRQLKMIGMFILLTFLSLYLFLTESIGFAPEQVAGLRTFSPLQHVERILTSVVQGVAVNQFIIYILVVVMLIGVIANLLILNYSTSEEVKEDEGIAEAN